MAIAFVEGQVKSSGSSPAATSAFSNTIVAGQLLVAYGGMDGGVTGDMTGVTDNKGNTWTRVTGMDIANGAGTLAFDAWYCVPTTGGSGYIVTVAFDDASTNINYVVQYFNGFTGLPTLDKFQRSSNTSSTTATSGATAATTAAIELVVGGAVHASTASAFSLGSGYTNLTQSSVSARQTAMESKVVGSTGAQTATFTIAAARVNIGGVVTFKDVATNSSPTIALNTTDGNAFVTSTPAVEFTGSDTDSDDLRYTVQIDTVNTFDSQGVAASLLAGTGKQLGASGGTTTAIDTTGANLIIVGLSFDNGGTANLTDSKGNTWTGLTAHNVVGNGVSKMYYCFNPTVGSGHTFSSTSIFSSINVQAWSGAASAPLDVQNGATATAATLASGSITPSLNGEIVVSHFMYSVAGTASVDTGLTISDQENFVGGANYGSAMGYIVQPTAGAINPTWTSGGGSTPIAATIASFKTGGAAGPLLEKVSGTDPGFANTVSGGDTDPFTAGNKISYTVQSALPDGTYYWRAKVIDPGGVNTYSSYATTRSFTITTSAGNTSAFFIMF